MQLPPMLQPARSFPLAIAHCVAYFQADDVRSMPHHIHGAVRYRPMNLNPYQAPVVSAPTLDDEQRSGDASYRRPLGVWLLSGLHLLVGVLFLVMFVLIGWLISVGRPTPRDVPVWMVFSLFAFVVLLALASGIGLWRGSRWGWWLTGFYYVWAALSAIPEVAFLLWTFEWSIELLAPVLAQKLILFAIHVAILFYLFRGTVRGFCRVKSVPALTALTVLGVIALIFVAATVGLSYSQPFTEL
jgi:hypothetical protein